MTKISLDRYRSNQKELDKILTKLSRHPRAVSTVGSQYLPLALTFLELFQKYIFYFLFYAILGECVVVC